MDGMRNFAFQTWLWMPVAITTLSKKGNPFGVAIGSSKAVGRHGLSCSAWKRLFDIVYYAQGQYGGLCPSRAGASQTQNMDEGRKF